MIIYYLMTLIECSLYTLVYRLLFYMPITKKMSKHIILFASLSFLQIGIGLLGSLGGTILTSIVSCTLILLFLCDGNRTQMLKYSPLVLMMVIVLGNTVYILTKPTIEFIINHEMTKQIIDFCSVLILLVVLLIIYMLKFRSIDLEPIVLDRMLYLILFLGLASSLLIISFTQYLTAYNLIRDTMADAVNLLSSVVSLLFVFLTFRYYHTEQLKKRLEHDNMDYQITMRKQSENINSIILKRTQLRQFRHDYKSQLTYLQGLINEQNIKEAQNYLSEITMRGAISDSVRYTGIPALDYVIDEYRIYAKEHGISWEFEGSLPLFENADYYPLCTIFSNLLKNAQEANEKVAGEKFVKTTVSALGRLFIIRMENSCVGGSVEEVTTKEDRENHGFGIKNIRETASRHDGFYRAIANDSVYDVTVALSIEDYKEER